MPAARDSFKIGAIGIAALFGYGLLLVGLGIAFSLVFGNTLPDWKWWHYLVGALVIGVLALVLEVAFLPFHRALIDADRTSDPAWERSLRAVALVIIGCAFLFGTVLLRQHGIL